MGHTLYFMKNKPVSWSQVKGAGGTNRVWRAIQSFLQELFYLNDFGLKSRMVKQKCKINVTVIREMEFKNFSLWMAT